MNKGWIGVDLDGTLAYYTGIWTTDLEVGAPIPLMVKRVQHWLASGFEVRILTARVNSKNPRREAVTKVIQDWCETNIGQTLEVTAEKDYDMIILWDDRAVRVETNTGKILSKERD